MLTEDTTLDVLENDTPEPTDNGVRPEDGVQPTPEEIEEMLATLLEDDEDE